MKRHKSLYKLSHSHHHGLVLAQLIKKNAPAYKDLPVTLEGKIKYTKKAFEQDLLPHFYDEEKILFPMLYGKSREADAECDEIKEEHRRIKELVELLDKSNDKEKVLDDLGNLLTAHIRKEEKGVFMKAQSILTEDELSKLRILLEGKE